MNDSTFKMMCKEFKDNIVEMNFEPRYSHNFALTSYNSAIASFMYAERLKDFRKFQKSVGQSIDIEIFQRENPEEVFIP